MRRFIFVLALAMFLWQPASAQQLLSPSEFRDAAIAMIRAADPRAEIELRGELGINLRRPQEKDGAEEQLINFDNAFTEYRRDPASLTNVLDRYVAFVLAPRDPTPTQARLVPVVRTRDRVEGYRTVFAQMDPPAEVVTRRFVGDLFEVLVYDSPDAVQVATAESLRELGLSTEQAWALAHRNIPIRMGALEAASFAEAPGVSFVAGGNGLAPSSLLQADICAGAGAGDLFLVPDRDGYWRADNDVAGALDFFRGFARHLIRTGQSESTELFTCRNGRLVTD